MDKQDSEPIMRPSNSQGRHYSEKETAQHCHVEVKIVRRLHAAGLIESIELQAGERHYSEEQMARLRRIRRLQNDLGVNLAGIEVILRLLERLEALQRDLASRQGL